MPHMFTGVVQGGLLGMVPFDPMGQISDKNRQSEVRNGRCVCSSVHQTASGVRILATGPSLPGATLLLASNPYLPLLHLELANLWHELRRYCQQGATCALQCAWQPCLEPSCCVIVAHTTRTPAQLNGLDAVWCSPPRWPVCAFAAMQRTIVDGIMLGS